MTAPIEASYLAGCIAEHAYRSGAGVVTCLYEDPAALLARLRYADESTLDLAPDWLLAGVRQALETGAAYLQVLGPYPDLLAGLPMERMLRLHASLTRAGTAETTALAEGLVNTCRLPFATRNWAHKVYPQATLEQAVGRLWEAIFAVTRTNQQNSVGALANHIAIIDARREHLQRLQLTVLRFRDDKTDLHIGLVRGHRWCGGSTVAGNGVAHVRNLAVEEVFVAADPGSASGRVVLTRPLALAGTEVDDVVLEFRNGRVESITASHGRQALETLLAMGDGGRRLGQVGLAPAYSPLLMFGSAFFNPLLDRSIGCHFAFGKPDPACLPEGQQMGTLGMSGIHLDCVFGGPNTQVDGVDVNGKEVAIMRGGRFVL